LQVVKHWWAITGGNQWPKENLAWLPGKGRLCPGRQKQPLSTMEVAHTLMRAWVGLSTQLNSAPIYWPPTMCLTLCWVLCAHAFIVEMFGRQLVCSQTNKFKAQLFSTSFVTLASS
jgi:hypothetical protein